MEQQSKYYKAEPEDVCHLNLEYKVNRTLGFNNDYFNEIIKLKEDSAYCIDLDNLLIMMDDGYGEVLIKYLDQEDIESLGWTIDKVHEGKDQELYYKDNIVLYYRYRTKELGIFTRDPSKNEYYSKYNVDPCRIQSLIIKNKSELKKLMKQLSIYE